MGNIVLKRGPRNEFEGVRRECGHQIFWTAKPFLVLFQDFTYEKGTVFGARSEKAAPPHGNKRNLFPSLPPVSFSIRGTEEGGGGGKVARSLSHNNVAKIRKKEEFLAPYRICALVRYNSFLHPEEKGPRILKPLC